LRKIFHLFVICLVVVTALTFVAIQNKKTNINSLNGNVKAGIHYIESKEQENPEKVYSELSSRQKKLEEELEFKEKNIRDAEIDNCSGESRWFYLESVFKYSDIRGFKSRGFRQLCFFG